MALYRVYFIKDEKLHPHTFTARDDDLAVKYVQNVLRERIKDPIVEFERVHIRNPFRWETS